jgi:hypothetical protein
VLERGFDSFWKRREELNRCIAALQFSQRLTLHEIGTLRPHLRSRTLGELYPAALVRGSFDYRLGLAETHLDEASSFLADAAFVSCQPAYEHYLEHVVEMLDAIADSSPGQRPSTRDSIVKKHNWVRSSGVQLDGPALELFDVLREARNGQVHRGAVVNDPLADARRALSQEAQNMWTRVAAAPLPSMNVGDLLPAGTFDPVAVVYSIGVMGLSLNQGILASGRVQLPRWADWALLDYRCCHPAGWGGDGAAKLKKLRGHTVVKFGAALPALVDEPQYLAEALARAPRKRGLPPTQVP